MDWKRLLSNMTSRKFLGMVTILVSSLLTLFRVDTETIVQVISLVTALLAVVAYIVVEGAVDAKAAGSVWVPDGMDEMLAGVEDALREQARDE